MAAVAGAQRVCVLLGYAHRQGVYEHSGKDLRIYENLVDSAEQDHESADSSDRPEQVVPTDAPGGGEAYARSRGIRVQLALCYGIGHFVRGGYFRLYYGTT